MSEYGTLLALAALAIFFSVATWSEQHPAGEIGGRQVAPIITRRFDPSASVLVVARDNQEDREFSRALHDELQRAGFSDITLVNGSPADARQALQALDETKARLDVVVCTQATTKWNIWDHRDTQFPSLATAPIVQPQSYGWPNFLKPDNLLNVTNQIAVIAIIAIGMTMVIITAGIDLSVGSLVALSAVVSALLIRDVAGAQHATALGMTISSLGGIAVCTVVGLFSGTMVTLLGIPPFIVTLAMMLVASGLAYIVSDSQSIYELPDSFIWLGRGAHVAGVPNAVLLMVILYALAHVMMTRMTLGRYIYAVGGNREAARLAGVPVRRVLLFVYSLSGALAGLGGVVLASQLKSGAPTYGQMYELSVIAAVVVGGTSLAGGEGKVLGTLTGALIIAVIQNGMNLTNVESNTQRVVLGLVILGAVALDKVKRRGWELLGPTDAVTANR
jgi:ribose transport system permease protein